MREKMADTLKDVMSPEEYAAVWKRVQFGRQSGVTWIEIHYELRTGSIRTDGTRDPNGVSADSDDVDTRREDATKG